MGASRSGGWTWGSADFKLEATTIRSTKGGTTLSLGGKGQWGKESQEGWAARWGWGLGTEAPLREQGWARPPTAHPS